MSRVVIRTEGRATVRFARKGTATTGSPIEYRGADGKIATWDAGAERILGYAESEIIGHYRNLNRPAHRKLMTFRVGDRTLLGDKMRRG